MRWILTAMALALASSWTIVGQAGEDEHSHARNCPRCHGVCYPTVTKGTETKSCWNVESKTICIPKVRFPWESRCCDKGCGKDGCLPPKPGRTRTINVLVKHEYECSTCKYSFDINGDKVDDGKYDKAPAVEQPTPAEPPAAASAPASTRRVAPAAFEQPSAATPVTTSYTDVIRSFFR